ncbi:hypothetical protein SAMN03080615_03384 [Amphritea atlantica]|uniref:Uncharacterized protein n=1 Tax=Amphritea atlantica TaxID=355243 RepID=A0A1H9K926_9GAMM|nr:hypothetical protein [Amphritea atlantica]SEQ95568.1 hypothetical protein SAMN03080615_03384 [Amphritea atlantica]
MRKLFIHIGRHKSGTSSLQKFLCQNYELLLEFGYEYPLLGRRPIAHHLLAKALSGTCDLDESDKYEVDELLLSIENSQCNVILSSEAFQNVKPQSLARVLKGDFDIYIVCYFRDQLSYLLSSYSQAIQNQALTESIEQYSKRLFNNLNYNDFIKSWEEAFPDASLIVRSFDKKLLTGEDIRVDFLDVLSLNELERFRFDSKDQNPSIGNKLLEYKKALNRSIGSIGLDTKLLYRVLSELSGLNADYSLDKKITQCIYDVATETYTAQNLLFKNNWGIQLSDGFKDVSVSNSTVELDVEDIFSITAAIEAKHSTIGLKIIDSLDDIFDIPTPPLNIYVKFIQDRFGVPIFDEAFCTELVNEEVLIGLVSKLLSMHIGLQDTIALSSLVKLKLRQSNQFNLLINEIAIYQNNLKLDISHRGKGVTVLSSIVRPDSEHMGVILNHAVPLVLAGEKVSIVLMAEMEWPSWRKQAGEAFREKFTRALVEYLDKSALDYLNKELVCSELRIFVSPRPNILASLLCENVIRFEGVARFRCSNVYAKDILNKCNVTTVLFSSAVADVKYTDRVLVRHENPLERQISFHPPIRIKPDSDRVFNMTSFGGIKKLISVYSSNRISHGLSNLTDNDWCGLEKLFTKYPYLSWTLIGAADVTVAYEAIPDSVPSFVRERILIMGVSSLDTVYRSDNVILALPGIPGAGGVGISSLKHGMLVLTIDDMQSDLNNLVPESLRFANMEMIFKKIAEINSGQDVSDYFFAIKERLSELGDLRGRGKALSDIVNLNALDHS